MKLARTQLVTPLAPELRADRIGLIAEGLTEGLRDSAFETLLSRIDCGRIQPGGPIDVFTRGEDAFAAMLRAIDAAREEVLVESFILKDDHVGRMVQAALHRAVRRGADVRVLADAFGSFWTPSSFWEEMAGQGIEVRLFRPLLRTLWSLRRGRDHRKILVADRRVAFTGGMNIADDYGSSRDARGGVWRDTQVRVHGSAAAEFAAVFSHAWTVAGGSLDGIDSARGSQVGNAPKSTLVLDSLPGPGDGKLASVFAAILGGARRTAWITNSYFAPTHGTAAAIVRAAQRGVDVRLLLPGRTDVPVVRHAGHGYFAELLAHGVGVFEYQPTVLHAKTIVADEFVSMIGSSNLDFRSLHWNSECDLVILDDVTGQRMTDVFREDIARSVSVRPERWSRRGWFHRIGDSLASSLRPLL